MLAFLYIIYFLKKWLDRRILKGWENIFNRHGLKLVRLFSINTHNHAVFTTLRNSL